MVEASLVRRDCAKADIVLTVLAASAHRPHPDALVDRERPGFDNTLLQTPALAAGVLKVQVSLVNPVRLDFSQRTPQMVFVEPERRQQKGLGNGQAFDGGFT